jgi:hypothetical protein
MGKIIFIISFSFISINIFGIDINIISPSEFQVLQDEVPMQVEINSTYTLQIVTASIQERVDTLKFNVQSNMFECNFNLDGLPVDTLFIVIYAVDILNNEMQDSIAIIHIPAPSINFKTPIQWSVANPIMHLQMEIENAVNELIEDANLEVFLSPDKYFISEYFVIKSNIDNAAFKIDTLVNLTAFSGKKIYIKVQVIDSKNKRYIKETEIFCESSPHFKIDSIADFYIQNFDGVNLYNDSSKLLNYDYWKSVDTLVAKQYLSYIVKSSEDFIVFLDQWTLWTETTAYGFFDLYKRTINDSCSILLAKKIDYEVIDVSDSGDIVYLDSLKDLRLYSNGDDIKIAQGHISEPRLNNSILLYLNYDSLFYYRQDLDSTTFLTDQATNKVFEINGTEIIYEKPNSVNVTQTWSMDSLYNTSVLLTKTGANYIARNEIGEVLYDYGGYLYLLDTLGNDYYVCKSGYNKWYYFDNWYTTVGKVLLSLKPDTTEFTYHDINIEINKNDTLLFDHSQLIDSNFKYLNNISVNLSETPKQGIIYKNDNWCYFADDLGSHYYWHPFALNHISSLYYVPERDYIGKDRIKWFVSDGVNQKYQEITYNIIIKEDTTLNANVKKIENNLILYPNPAYNILRIKFTDQKIEIKSIQIIRMTGEIINSYREINNGEIDIRDLIPGVYFLRVISSRKIYITKFVKE